MSEAKARVALEPVVMSDHLTIEEALELENHFIQASKALKCAWRKMKRFPQFERTAAEVADAALDADEAAKHMRQFITDNS